MEGPTEEYILIREVELDGMGSPRYPMHRLSKDIIPKNDSRPPLGATLDASLDRPGTGGRG